MSTIKTSILFILYATISLGIVYPIVIYGLTFFPFNNEQKGLPLVHNNRIVGYRNIVQQFSSDYYFHGRPSATQFATIPSGASNVSPYSKTMIATSKKFTDSIRSHGYSGIIPSDLLTQSASGLDPDISLESAVMQVQRIAKARKVHSEKILSFVTSIVKNPQFAIFGTTRVNVLELNILLDQTYPYNKEWN
jgi:K+-transporting ATPase ATPase C chain